MPLKKQIEINALVASILLLATLTGCARTVTLYPIKDTDIYFKDNGDVCMSEFYFKEVLNAKLEEE